MSADILPAANPADPYERQAQTFPTLGAQQIERAKAFGCVQELPKGTVLFERGQRTVDFFIVLGGNIEIHEPAPTGRACSRFTSSVSSPANSTCSTTATSWSAAAWGRTGG